MRFHRGRTTPVLLLRSRDGSRGPVVASLDLAAIGEERQQSRRHGPRGGCARHAQGGLKVGAPKTPIDKWPQWSVTRRSWQRQAQPAITAVQRPCLNAQRRSGVVLGAGLAAPTCLLCCSGHIAPQLFLRLRAK
eukprot:scaffold187681_cov29-Tisochrysis_lutea.AAC.2